MGEIRMNTDKSTLKELNIGEKTAYSVNIILLRSETRRYRKHTAGLASMTVTVLWS